MPRFFKPRMDAPFPLWMIFPVIFAALYATHFTLLGLPYYWDEAGYYIPAAWDFFRTGSLIPITTLTNAHPPLPSIYLAFWWKSSGYLPEVTRQAVLLVASLGLLAVWRLAMRLIGVPSVAFWTTLLTGLYPIWFAQSTLAHADIFAAACSLWGLVYVLPEHDRRPALAALWFSLAALSKETSIGIPLTFAVIAAVRAFRSPGPARIPLLKQAAWMVSCLVPLAAWYAYHRAKTGYLFGNPEFLRYNAQSTLDAVRILAAFGHRILHLTAHMNMFVPMLMTVAALLLPVRTERAGDPRAAIPAPVIRTLLILLVSNAALFSVLGGALLTRYLLPMYPLVLLIAVTTFYRRIPYWHGIAAFSAMAFLVGLFVNPPYGFAPEDNLAYTHVIRLHQSAIHELARRYPGATVLTAWPMSDELTRPELGYVRHPWDVERIDDFTPTQIAQAAAEPQKYSAALVFSTKYDPPVGLFPLGGESLDERFFGLHHDLQPDAIARRLGGDMVWRRDDEGFWAGLIRFNRPVEARLEIPR